MTRVLRPAALSPSAVATLVTRRLASTDEAFVAACARATEGNPYLLAELLTDLRRRGLAPTAAAAASSSGWRPTRSYRPPSTG